MICNATLCQKTWGTTFTGTWSKNWKGRYWVIMCKPFVLQASSSCLCFSLGLEEINESPESWMLLEETARFPLFLHPEWDVSNNVPAYSAQCKTTNVSRAFIQGMYPLHNNGGSQKCAPCHSDEYIRKLWDSLLNAAPLKAGSQIPGGGLAYSHCFLPSRSIQATGCLKKDCS